MTGRTRDKVVLFPKTLEYYQIRLTQLLESEQYKEAKQLLLFLLQCGGEAERHHTEWQALLGWLESAFPESADSNGGPYEDRLDELTETEWARRHAEDRSEQDPRYVSRLLETLLESQNMQQQLLILGQLRLLKHPDIEPTLRQWLENSERHPAVQFSALQALRHQEAAGTVTVRRDGEAMEMEISAVPLSFSEFPPAVQDVLDRVRQAAEITDPSLAYFAEELWKECVQAAYGSALYRSILEDRASSRIWAAALHQILQEKLHGLQDDEEVREIYEIDEDMRFRYEQALRWIRTYAAAPDSLPNE